jgi:hypothetical protein
MLISLVTINRESKSQLPFISPHIRVTSIGLKKPMYLAHRFIEKESILTSMPSVCTKTLRIYLV